MMKLGTVLGVFISLTSLTSAVFAQTVAGNWTTIDDKTGKKRAIVRIDATNDGDKITGTIIQTYPEPGDSKFCDHCPGEFKDKPIVGLQFAWGLKKVREDEWEGGKILDPSTGKIYKVKMALKDNKLYVHGYIGMSFIGRTQVWIR